MAAEDLPVTDNHLHIDSERGLGPVQVGRLFSRSGGTHAMVVNRAVNFSNIGEFRRNQETFLSDVEKMNSAVGIRAFPVVGPHPAALPRLWEAMGKQKAIELVKQALESSAGLVRDGRATALGEVGRPHFEVPADMMDASNSILDRSLELAVDIGCAVQLHMESSTPVQFRELRARADRAGLPPWRVVKHFSPPLVVTGRETGIVPSVVSTRGNIREALAQGDRFLMETDFMDDPDRPGAVLGPRTVPRVTRALMEEGTMDESSARRIHVELVERTYGIDVSI